MRALVCLIAVVGLFGCGSTPRETHVVQTASGEYARAFEAVKETLLASRFELDRIDAANGVITTQPKATMGVFSPWDGEQSDLSEEIRDGLNAHVRVVRVYFTPLDQTEAAATATPGSGIRPPVDLRTTDEALRAVVEVVVYERQAPPRRLETESIRRSKVYQDPEPATRGLGPTYLVPIRQDESLRRRLASEIAARIGAG